MDGDPVLINDDSVEEGRRAVSAMSPPGGGTRTRSVTAELFDSLKTRFSSASDRTESTNYEDLSSPDDSAATDYNEKYRTLTTFSGVFAPVALSMFSAILFLRLGFILGNSGLYLTIFQLVLAYVILFFTVLSVCSIATNGAIQGGGVYFMISRAMGPEFGGAIGTLFFTANVFSSALYLTGCVEGIMNNFGPSGAITRFLPSGYWWKMLYGTVLNLMNVIICLIGASLFAKTSVLIFVILLVCIGSVIVSLVTRHHFDIPVPHENWQHNGTLPFSGFSMQTFQENLKPNFTLDYSTDYQMTSFASVFGVLFSGVTGIMAGANISGELKDPNNSIPKGTIRAMVFTFVTYLILFFTTAFSCPRELLINNYIYMQWIDYVPVLVAIGIFAATFSASLSNLIGASRVLEALSKDKLFGALLNPVTRYSAPGNPISAVLITWLLIQLIILMNQLNLIAQITSVFFLLSYFATNFACLSLTLTSAPNFRPTFKYYDWKTATIGIIGTSVMMFVINPVYAAVTILLCMLLVVVLHIRSPPFRWGSITQALIFHQVRKYLLILDSRKDHVKYWRPHILLMVSNPRSCIPLIRFANDLKKSGLFIIGHVKRDNLDDYDVDPVLKESPQWLKLLDLLAVKAFFELTLAPTVREGFHHLVRMTGLGAMKPNTVFLGFYDDEPPVDFLENDPYIIGMIPESDAFPAIRAPNQEKNLTEESYTLMIYETIFKFKKNICIGRHFNSFQRDLIPKLKNKIIDIWPMDFFHRMDEIPDNSWKFMLQLACILKMVPVWKHSTKLRLLMSSYKFENHEQLKSRWTKRMKKLRIECQLEIVTWNEEQYGPYEIDYYNTGADEMDAYFTNVNRFLCTHSSQSNLVFLYLPAPVVQRKSSSANNHHYLKHLTIITENLPPTILAHGITEVTSDSL